MGGDWGQNPRCSRAAEMASQWGLYEVGNRELSTEVDDKWESL